MREDPQYQEEYTVLLQNKVDCMIIGRNLLAKDLKLTMIKCHLILCLIMGIF